MSPVALGLFWDFSVPLPFRRNLFHLCCILPYRGLSSPFPVFLKQVTKIVKGEFWFLVSLYRKYCLNFEKSVFCKVCHDFSHLFVKKSEENALTTGLYYGSMVSEVVDLWEL